MGAIAIDPLIAEARRRARRRGLAAVAVLAAGGLGVFLALRGSGAATPPARSAAEELRAIRQAAAHATIVASRLESGERGWAMNGLGLWLTSDGGVHWRTVTPLVPGGDVVARIGDVQFVDARHGWASGQDLIGRVFYKDGSNRFSMIERTVDGGRMWIGGKHNCAACGGSLSFLDAHRGFTLANRSLFATRDGGVTWRRVGTTPFRGDEIEFVDTSNGWGTAWSGGLYRTRDGGRTWRLVLRGHATLPRFGVVAVQTRHGTFVVHGGVRHGLPILNAPFAPAFAVISPLQYVAWRRDGFWQTRDGGATWKPLPSKVHPAMVSDLQFDSPSHGWAIFTVGSGAALVETTNGGRDWLPLTP